MTRGRAPVEVFSRTSEGPAVGSCGGRRVNGHAACRVGGRGRGQDGQRSRRVSSRDGNGEPPGGQLGRDGVAAGKQAGRVVPQARGCTEARRGCNKEKEEGREAQTKSGRSRPSSPRRPSGSPRDTQRRSLRSLMLTAGGQGPSAGIPVSSAPAPLLPLTVR